MLQKITTNLWFNSEAETAARFYTAIFPNSEIGTISRFSTAGQEIHGMDEGKVMTVMFTLEGCAFVALNGGPHFTFNEAISFIVHCDAQEEVDYYWEKLGEGGDSNVQQCGWLKDQFGVSWQIVPVKLYELITHSDKERANRATEAMLKMKKLEIRVLEKAFAEG